VGLLKGWLDDARKRIGLTRNCKRRGYEPSRLTSVRGKSPYKNQSKGEGKKEKKKMISQTKHWKTSGLDSAKKIQQKTERKHRTLVCSEVREGSSRAVRERPQ